MNLPDGLQDAISKSKKKGAPAKTKWTPEELYASDLVFNDPTLAVEKFRKKINCGRYTFTKVCNFINDYKDKNNVSELDYEHYVEISKMIEEGL